MAVQAQRSFTRQFWNDATGRLCDVVNGDQRDGANRPKEIFAVSLPYPMLSPDQARRVVDDDFCVSN
jgi:glycogen debranching enzyme